MQDQLFEATIDERGRVSIPVDVLQDLRLQTGARLWIGYHHPTEPIDHCLFIEEHTNIEENMNAYMCIPKEILEECGISMSEGDVHIMCFDQELTITTANKMIGELPDAMINLCERLHIQERDIAKAIAEECCKNG